MRRRTAALKEYERHPDTFNKYLSEEHMLKKMRKLHQDLRTEKKKHYTLQEKMQEMFKKGSVRQMTYQKF